MFSPSWVEPRGDVAFINSSNKDDPRFPSTTRIDKSEPLSLKSLLDPSTNDFAHIQPSEVIIIQQRQAQPQQQHLKPQQQNIYRDSEQMQSMQTLERQRQVEAARSVQKRADQTQSNFTLGFCFGWLCCCCAKD